MLQKEFEAYYQEEVSGCNGEWLEKDSDGDYLERDTQNAWEVWQAAVLATRDHITALMDAHSLALDNGGKKYRRPLDADRCAILVKNLFKE